MTIKTKHLLTILFSITFFNNSNIQAMSRTTKQTSTNKTLTIQLNQEECLQDKFYKKLIKKLNLQQELTITLHVKNARNEALNKFTEHFCKYNVTNLTISGGDLKTQIHEPINNITDLFPIVKLKKLKCLTITKCRKVETLPLMNKLKKLQILTINSCSRLTDIDSLRPLRSLQILTIKNCKNIRTFHALSSLRNLYTLSIINCKGITNLAHMSNLKNLQILIIEMCNNITSLRPIVNLPQLHVLVITNCNRIETFYHISSLISLRELTIKNCNTIVRLPEMKKLQNLIILNLFENENLKDTNSIYQLKNLELLSINKQTWKKEVKSEEEFPEEQPCHQHDDDFYEPTFAKTTSIQDDPFATTPLLPSAYSNTTRQHHPIHYQTHFGQPLEFANPYYEAWQ